MSRDSLDGFGSNFDDEGGRRQDEAIEQRFTEEREIQPLVDAMEAEASEEYRAFMAEFPDFDEELAKNIEQVRRRKKADLN